MGKWDKYKKNKPENNDSNSVNNGMVKTVINWYKPTLVNFHVNPYFIILFI